MRLRRLDLTRYGKFTGKVLDFGEALPGQPDFHIVYGLNEAGKSTAFSAWLDLLFGIQPKSQYNFLHPYDAMQIGGVIEAGGEAHELVRTKKKQNALTDPRGQPVNEALIASLLRGVGRDAYRTMFSLDEQSLREGGEDILKSEGNLGELLFSASAGLADIGKTLVALRGEADMLYRARASSTELAKLKSELANLKEKRAQIDTQASAYAALSQEEAEARKAHAATEADLAAARSRLGEITRLLKALPAASELSRVDAALSNLSNVPRPAQDLIARLPRLMQDETRLETRRRGLEENLESLKRALDGTERDDAILALSARIAALEQTRHRHRSAEPDLPRRRLELAEQEAALALHLKALDRPDEADAAGLILPARLVARLRDLIAERSGIETALKASAREAERVRGQAEEIEAERQSLKADHGDEGAVERLGRLSERLQKSDSMAKLAMEVRTLDKLRREADQALAALEPVSLQPEALRTLTVPDRRQFDRWRDRASDLSKRRHAVLDRIRTLENEERQALARIKAVAEGAEALDDAKAAALREARDTLWQAHLAALTRETAADFETALRKDDAASQTRLSRAHDLADLRQAMQARVMAEASLEPERALLAEVEDEIARLADMLTAAFPADLQQAADTVEDHVEQLRLWAERHQRWLNLFLELEEAEERVEDLRDAILAGLDELGLALADAGLAVSLKADAQALFALADRHIAEAEKAALRRAEFERRERQLQEDARSRARDVKSAQDAANIWQQEWDKALAETWFAGEPSIAAVRANLDALGELPALIRERDQLKHRIKLMEEDQTAFAAEVMALCELAGISCSPTTIRFGDESLVTRFEAAQRTEDARTEKTRQIAALEEDLQALSAEITAHAADRARLLSGLEIETLNEADAQVERVKERDRLEARRKELTEQLLGDLRAADLSAAQEKLGTLDADALDGEQALIEERILRLSEEAQKLYGRLTLAKSRLDAVGGDGAVAAIEAERATVLLAIEDIALRYLKLRTGALAAGSALDLYREKHRSTMMTRASEAFRMITRGEYSGLSARPDKDRETLIGIPRDGGSRMADAMSTGTRYQLYLALRLAGYEEFARVSPPVPFIADDIMETFDELRSEEVFRLFGEMAGIGQVIYLTHHRHLCDIAKAVVPAVRIHQL